MADEGGVIRLKRPVARQSKLAIDARNRSELPELTNSGIYAKMLYSAVLISDFPSQTLDS